MKVILPSVSLVLLTALVGCSEPTVDQETEGLELMQLSRDWSAMVGAGDFEGAIDVWADDAVMLPPDLPLLSGKSAISEYVAGAASIPGFKISWEPESAFVVAGAASIPGFKISWEPESAFVSKSGDVAYLIERNVIEMEDENGETIVTHGKVVTIWRKDAQGQWKNVVDMWNSTPAPADSG